MLPTHDVHVSQQVMYQDSTSKYWYPAVIEGLCPEPGSHKITTRNGITYRKMQAYLKPFTPQNKNFQSNQCVTTTNGTIQQYVASETIWPQEVTSEQ